MLRTLVMDSKDSALVELRYTGLEISLKVHTHVPPVLLELHIHAIQVAHHCKETTAVLGIFETPT